jgi:hypothetical protein
MTKKELWKIYAARNPTFDGEGTVTMTAAGLRKLFDTTWDTAFYDGEDEPCSQKEQSSASVETLMKMFGMKP